jgi:hypothetical protein
MALSQDETVVLPPESRGLTFEKVWALCQENAQRHKELEQLLKETIQRQEETIQRQEEAIQHQEEVDKRRKEAIDQGQEENIRLLRQNQKMMSDLGRKFGTVIEHMFIPNLKEKFNALGYVFEKSAPNVLIGSKEHNLYTEIDVFLENSETALAVEVKTQVNIADVRDHMQRMGKLRKYFDLHRDSRKLYGAVAGAIIHGNVQEYALKQGFYIIQHSGDNVNIVEPRDRPKAW